MIWEWHEIDVLTARELYFFWDYKTKNTHINEFITEKTSQLQRNYCQEASSSMMQQLSYEHDSAQRTEVLISRFLLTYYIWKYTVV